jgi:hypothetical protein
MQRLADTALAPVIKQGVVNFLFSHAFHICGRQSSQKPPAGSDCW